ncbi:MAG: competence/damage-inducible protein A [Rhodospirillaceae bacterium]|nr:competence/damage-inducible protein A [Rhodospirillaceae bacterium]
MSERPPTTAIVIIGDEILSGRTRDANVSFLGERLAARGLPVREVRIIADDTDAIGEAVNTLRLRHRYVFTSGGIGPTHDDITAGAMAIAFGVALERNAEAQALLEAHYPPEMRTAARMKMADIPAGASLVDNPVSKAPGFRLDNVFVLAGVPQILQAMFDGIEPTLEGGVPMVSVTVSCDLGEGVVAEGLGAIQAAHPEVSIGSYPYFRPGHYGASLVVRGTDPVLVAAVAAEVSELVRALGGHSAVVDAMAAVPDAMA